MKSDYSDIHATEESVEISNAQGEPPIQNRGQQGAETSGAGEKPEAEKNPKSQSLRTLELMTKSVFFRQLDPDSLAILASKGCQKKFETGQAIYNQGDKYSGIHLVVSGLVDVFMTNSAGRERLICRVGTGLLLGSSTVLRDDEFPCWIRASKPTETIYLPKTAIQESIDQNPVALVLMETMARHLGFFWELLESSGERLMPRLASFLLSLPEVGGMVTLPMTRTQLAHRLGTTPESLSRSFSRLKTAGIINSEGKELAIIDRDHLISIITIGELSL